MSSLTACAALVWRAMTPADLPAVLRIAALVHPGYPERAEVFAERLRLHPAGCLVLDGADGPAGYCISHPWRGEPPALDTLLGALPARPEAWYVHDVALLPAARGQGAPAALLARLRARAAQAGLNTLSLTAVNGSAAYWQRQGFDVLPASGARLEKLGSYGADARLMACAL
ncbi:GNAT family N-acetyltransferase [Azohydromonas caseinilytica]|uniref:GNAT family N-acetyltransferase n=1 Tax=Azohydromonas caseinilytica TaxID=2728836 RepID=A0A848FG73_9BURK|nr:GNAT family N-acetyltransferase [Azohydromonas caseinilytica]NML16881.1 GNAT family N-acetyltransferase [Azohydromonas caseinilytica]